MENETEKPASAGLRKLGINSVIYILGDMFTKGIAFLFIPIYTRLLSPAEYGNWAVLLSLISLIGIIFSLQLGSSLSINYYQFDEDKQREFVSTLLVTTMFTSALFFIIFTVVGRRQIGLFLPDLTSSNYILAIGVCFFVAINTIPQTLMRLRQNAMASVLVNSISYLLGIAVGVFLLVRLNFGVTGLLIGTLLASVFSVMSHIIIVRDSLVPKFSLSIAYRSIMVSLPIIPHMLSHWGLNLMDRLVLQIYLPLSEVGIYQLGYQIGTVFQIIVIAVNSAWTPYFMKSFDDKTQQLDLKTSSTWLVLLMVWSALVSMLLLPSMVRWIVPGEYDESVKIIPWIVTGFLFVGFYQFWINIILYYKKTMVVPLITAVSAILNLVLNLMLVPRYGYVVAAINTLTSYLVLACLAGLIAWRISSFAFDYFRWIKAVAAGGVLYVLALLTGNYLGENNSLWIGILATLTYPVTLWLVGFFSINEKEYFQKKIGVFIR